MEKDVISLFRTEEAIALKMLVSDLQWDHDEGDHDCNHDDDNHDSNYNDDNNHDNDNDNDNHDSDDGYDNDDDDDDGADTIPNLSCTTSSSSHFSSNPRRASRTSQVKVRSLSLR